MKRKGVEAIVPWEELPEEQREEYRSRFRSMGDSVGKRELPVIIRPILDKANTGKITELYGPLLETICEFEQNRRVQRLKQEGWTMGPDNPDLMTSSLMKSFSELSPSQQDEVRLAVRDYPKLLESVGLELVRRE